jgi:hypothetical protein
MTRYLTFFALIGMLSSISCTPTEPWTSDNPEFALGEFFKALSHADHETVWEYLSEESRERIADSVRQNPRSAALSDDLDGPRLLEFVYRAWTPSSEEIDRLETMQSDDSRATVAVHLIYGTSIEVHMVRADGRWLLDFAPDGEL